MGLGDVLGDSTDVDQNDNQQEQDEPDSLDKDKDVKVAGKSSKEIAEEVKKRLFLHEFVEELDLLVEAPERKEYVSSGDAEINEPLQEGYVDCTERVEFLGEQAKYLDCPHCDNNLRQRCGSGAKRGDTWTRCGGCGRILVDLEAGNRDDEGDVIEQQGISEWV